MRMTIYRPIRGNKQTHRKRDSGLREEAVLLGSEADEEVEDASRVGNRTLPPGPLLY